MATGGEGVCRFCGKTFSGTSMGRHLLACKAKKEKDAEEARGMEPEGIFHIRVVGGHEFWLHFEMSALSRLSDLDRFLRSTWLECCGHMSSFEINGQRYMSSAARQFGASSFAGRIGQVLSVKDTFTHEYDFGLTTEIEGRVVGWREGFPTGKARILARNRMPKTTCGACGKPAPWICSACGAFCCDACLPEHECGDGMMLPVVNSPRMGVCGYDGRLDKDPFDKVKASTGKGRKAEPDEASDDSPGKGKKPRSRHS